MLYSTICFLFYFPLNNLLNLYWLSDGLTHGGTGVPCPPFTSFSTRVLSAGTVCFGMIGFIFPVHCGVWYRGWNGGGGGGGEKGVVTVIWVPHLKMFRPAPSTHWGCCTLIRCAGTQDPRI